MPIGLGEIVQQAIELVEARQDVEEKLASEKSANERLRARIEELERVLASKAPAPEPPVVTYSDAVVAPKKGHRRK